MYVSWSGMLMRCYNPKNPRYKDYGGRGIRVCKKWHHYIGFLEDMAPTWKRGLTVERLDNDGSYTRANCIWATQSQQANNRKTNRRLTVDGVTLTVTEWERRKGFKPTTIFRRLYRGWDAEKSVNTPLCR
jgi:hypothetical protein